MSVASTVVLIRVLMDSGVMHTPPGRLGRLAPRRGICSPSWCWLFSGPEGGNLGGDLALVGTSLSAACGEDLRLVFLVLVVGKASSAFDELDRPDAIELFTLSVLVVAMGVAAGSALVFGVSMAASGPFSRGWSLGGPT